MKILSVIIPLYNSAKWLNKCLDSVLAQNIDLKELEIICINDGSPDNSADIAREYQTKYPETFVVLDQENQGPSGARNNGMRNATGKYLCFVDPDDYLVPNVYWRFIKQMEDENLDMLRFNFQRVDENDNILPILAEDSLFDYTPELMTGSKFIANRLGVGCHIWRYIYRTDVIKGNNIWCFTGDYYDDTPWLPLVLMKVDRMNICDVVAYNYLERTDGLVKISNPKAIKRKIDGQLLLIQLLNNEMETITDDGILSWYKNMKAHSAFSLLTMVACNFYPDRKIYIKKLKELRALPLKFNTKTTKKSAKKMKIVNFSVSLFMFLIHLKNRK